MSCPLCNCLLTNKSTIIECPNKDCIYINRNPITYQTQQPYAESQRSTENTKELTKYQKKLNDLCHVYRFSQRQKLLALNIVNRLIQQENSHKIKFIISFSLLTIVRSNGGRKIHDLEKILRKNFKIDNYEEWVKEINILSKSFEPEYGFKHDLKYYFQKFPNLIHPNSAQISRLKYLFRFTGGQQYKTQAACMLIQLNPNKKLEIIKNIEIASSTVSKYIKNRLKKQQSDLQTQKNQQQTINYKNKE